MVGEGTFRYQGIAFEIEDGKEWSHWNHLEFVQPPEQERGQLDGWKQIVRYKEGQSLKGANCPG